MENLNQKEVYYEKHSYSDFEKMLIDIEKDDSWEVENERNLTLSFSPAGSSCPVLRDANAMQVSDLKTEGGFILFNGFESFLVHPIALDTILERAGVKSVFSASLQDERTKDEQTLSALANMGLAHFGYKKCKILHRGGYAMAVHSEQYSIMPQYMGMSLINDEILSSFPDARFISGSYQHHKTVAHYEIFKKGDPILSNYEKAWNTAGLSPIQLDKTSGCLDVITSDTGDYTFSLTPFLCIGNTKVPLSTDLEVKHRGNNETAMLKKCVNDCFTIIGKTLNEDIPSLMDIKLEYPQQVLIRILDALKITKGGSKALAAKIVDIFECIYDTYSIVINEYGVEVPSPTRDTLTAYDIYWFIVEMQGMDEFQNLAELTRIKITEKLFTIPSMDFAGMDKNGPRNI